MKLAKIVKQCRIDKPEHFKLADHDPAESFGLSTNIEDVKPILAEDMVRMEELQQRLYADGRWSVLIVLQAMDAAGKDGVVKHVMSGVNPQGCEVHAFKAPTPEELAHDFLWRAAKVVPARGRIGIFNRSHYEDVLVARVHNLVPKSIWSERYDQINAFEKQLDENGVTILKFYLHISKEEQRRRFQARLDDPKKNWKLSAADFREREHWDEYMEAYEDALTNCSTKNAPWYVIPSDHKWFRNFAIGAIVNSALKRMKLRYPPATIDTSQIHLT